MSKRITAEVHVTLQVSVHVGNWDPKASFADLHEQADREARQSLAKHLGNCGINITGMPGAMRVVLTEAT